MEALNKYISLDCSGKCMKTGLTYAMKQQRPANLWEYYICLEIQSRIEFDNIVS